MSVSVEYEAKIKKFEQQLSRIEKKMKGVDKSASKSTKKIEKGFSKADTAVNNLTSQVGTLGAAFIGAFAIEGLLRGAINEMNEMIAVTTKFEKTFTNVLTLLNSADAEKFRKPLEEGAIDIMVEFGTSIEDTNKALFDAISAGVPAAEAINFLKENAILATGGVTSLSVAVDGTTSILNAYGLATTETTRITNAFFTAQKFGKTTVEELASGIGNVAPIAKQAGVSFETLLGVTAELTLGGLSTEESFTALQNAIASLLKPSDAARKVLEEFNIPIGATALRSEGLTKALQGLTRAAQENPDALAEMIPNIRAIRAIGGLTEEKLIDMDKIINQISTDLGPASSLMGAFAQQEETLAQITERATAAQEGLTVTFDSGTGVISRFLKATKKSGIELTQARIETLRYAESNEEELGPALSGVLDLLARFGGETGGVAGQALIALTNLTKDFADTTIEDAAPALDAFIDKINEAKLAMDPNIDAIEAMRLKKAMLVRTEIEVAEKTILTIKSIKAQITELKKQQETVELGSQKFNEITAEIKSLNDLLPKTTKSTTKATDAFTRLQDQISKLKREIQLEALANKDSTETTEKLSEATVKLEKAEIALNLALGQETEALKNIREDRLKAQQENIEIVDREKKALQGLRENELKDVAENEDERVEIRAQALRDIRDLTLESTNTTESEREQIIRDTEKEITNIRLEEAEKQKEQAEKDAEEAKIRQKELIDFSIGLALDAADTFFFIQNERLRNDNITLDSKQRKEEEALKKKNLSEERFGIEKAKLDEKFQDQRNKLKTKEAKADKLQALFNIAISTAIAVAKSIAASPLTGGLPFSAIVAVLGAVQLAIVASRPIPEFAKGTKDAPAGLSLVGERGPELQYTQKGAKIVPAHTTARYSGLIDSMMDNKLDDYINQYYVLPALQKAQDTMRKSTGERMADGLFMQGFNDKKIIRQQKKQSEILVGIYQNTKNNSVNKRNAWN